jgi:hypothetical protein
MERAARLFFYSPSAFADGECFFFLPVPMPGFFFLPVPNAEHQQNN